MRRRRVIVGLAVLALVGAVAAIVWPRDPHPCYSTFRKVREGMTYDEVCAAVGGPPGDYSDGANGEPLPLYDSSGLTHDWHADDGHLTVVFEPISNRVGEGPTGPVFEFGEPGLFPAHSVSVRRSDGPTLLGRLRARLGL